MRRPLRGRREKCTQWILRRVACIPVRVNYACTLVAFAVIIAILTAIIVMLVHQQQLSSSSVVTSDGMDYCRYNGTRHKQQYALARCTAADIKPILSLVSVGLRAAIIRMG